MWFVRAFPIMAVLDIFWTMTVRKVSPGPPNAGRAVLELPGHLLGFDHRDVH